MQNNGFHLVLTPVRAYQRIRMQPTRAGFNSELLVAARITIAITEFRVQTLRVKIDPDLVLRKSRTSILALSQSNYCNHTLALQSSNCHNVKRSTLLPWSETKSIIMTSLAPGFVIYESASIGASKVRAPWLSGQRKYIQFCAKTKHTKCYKTTTHKSINNN